MLFQKLSHSMSSSQFIAIRDRLCDRLCGKFALLVCADAERMSKCTITSIGVTVVLGPAWLTA